LGSIDSCARLSTTAPSSATRPDESSAFQTLGEQAQPIAIPPQQLDQITAAAAEEYCRRFAVPGQRNFVVCVM
jgi:hypothetical protein